MASASGLTAGLLFLAGLAGFEIRRGLAARVGVESDGIVGRAGADRLEGIAEGVDAERAVEPLRIGIAEFRRGAGRGFADAAGDAVERFVGRGEQFGLRRLRLRLGLRLAVLRRVLGDLGLDLRGRRGAFGVLGVRRRAGGLVGMFAAALLRGGGRAVDALFRLRRVFELHRIEVAGDDGLGVLVAGVDDPQHEEERHHRGHEIGEGDLPGAAVMAVAAHHLLLDDDDVAVMPVRHEISRSRQCLR